MSYVETLLAIILAAIGSTGLWAFLSKFIEAKDSKTQLLIGLAHNQILAIGMEYIKRGYITKDEYENLHDYLYVPYAKAGGNGSAKRIMQEVDKLPIRQIEDTTLSIIS